ncbi:MAG: DNA recombination/repair protein RecA [Acidobacteria bacterium]|nr:DNA recombination/repair protein RecA [Acidobacteriota bacterium]
MASALLPIPRVLPASQLAPADSRYPPLETPCGVRFPRGRITEIHGAASSGRTSLLYSALAQATAEGESCALVDGDDMFDPASAAAAGVELHRLLWVRCGSGGGAGSQHALRVTDLLLQSSGFGLVALDLASLDARAANRIPMSYWYRFRRAVEPTRTALVVLSPMANVRQCASLIVEPRRVEAKWSGTPGCSQLLDGVTLEFVTRKPAAIPVPPRYEARALTA